ncbi:MAG TPA: hypothetical protein VFI21_08850 [Nocardioides sp.]|nr:hypothetical protein [Nocardioides sp.]
MAAGAALGVRLTTRLTTLVARPSPTSWRTRGATRHRSSVGARRRALASAYLPSAFAIVLLSRTGIGLPVAVYLSVRYQHFGHNRSGRSCWPSCTAMPRPSVTRGGLRPRARPRVIRRRDRGPVHRVWVVVDAREHGTMTS